MEGGYHAKEKSSSFKVILTQQLKLILYLVSQDYIMQVHLQKIHRTAVAIEYTTWKRWIKKTLLLPESGEMRTDVSSQTGSSRLTGWDWTY